MGAVHRLIIAFLVFAGSQKTGDFSSKFFDDLNGLFGRLEHSALDQAFQNAKPIRCSDLISEKGEWKQVAFLNDDRNLPNWHRNSLPEVNRDLVRFVFSGTCRTEEGPVKVATTYPVKETVDRFRSGSIPFSKIVLKVNGAVNVAFDRSTQVSTFRLPFVYLRKEEGPLALYSLTPPLTKSKPEHNLTQEFRCKALNDEALTYRFLLCRTELIKLNVQAGADRSPLGSGAYYILSDGREAHTSVKLNFGDRPSPNF